MARGRVSGKVGLRGGEGEGGVGGGRVPKGWGHVDKGVHICPWGSSSCLQRHVCHGMPIPDAAIPALQTLQGQTHNRTSTGLCRP